MLLGRFCYHLTEHASCFQSLCKTNLNCLTFNGQMWELYQSSHNLCQKANKNISKKCQSFALTEEDLTDNCLLCCCFFQNMRDQLIHMKMTVGGRLNSLILLPCCVTSGLITIDIPSWLVSLSTALHVQPADVPFRFSALTRSCVVIPCSFPYQEDEPVTRGIWSKKTGDVIYHNAQSYVVDHFKGRTRILGDLNEGNCSLEIDDIKPFDNGPFCFHAERGNNDKRRFNNSCVFIVMKGLELPLIIPFIQMCHLFAF